MLEVEYKNTQCNNILLHSTVLLLHASLNMKVIGSSLTNQIAVIFYAPDNVCYSCLYLLLHFPFQPQD